MNTLLLFGFELFIIRTCEKNMSVHNVSTSVIAYPYDVNCIILVPIGVAYAEVILQILTNCKPVIPA